MSTAAKPSTRRARSSGGIDKLIRTRSHEVESGAAQLDFPAIAVLMSQKLGRPISADQCRSLHGRAIEKFRREWIARERKRRRHAS